MNRTVPPFLRAAAEGFAAAGGALYVVGGRPRNALLGLAGGDWDVCGPLPPDEAMALFAAVPGVTIAPRDTALGTFGALCGGEEAEYTTFRAESYGPGGGHRPQSVTFGVPQREDALRRDFTVNALYWDIAANELKDPLGGRADLERRVLRTCRAPEETFDDDGLRLMRLVRFCAELGFVPEEATARAARERAHLLRDIAPERLWGELKRLLLADTKYPPRPAEPPQGMDGQAVFAPASPVALGLHLFDELGLLDVVLPELAEGRGVAQRADYHDHDVLGHAFAACAAAPPRLTDRVAALLHDVGKPAALRRGGRMVGHDRIGQGMAAEILTRLRCPTAFVDEVSALIGVHMTDLDGRMGEGKLRLLFVRLGRARAEELIDLRRADVRGSKPVPATFDPAARWVAILARMDADRVPWTLADLAVNGGDLIALTGGPGPQVGKLLAALHRHAVLRPRQNTRNALLEQARTIWNDQRWRNEP